MKTKSLSFYKKKTNKKKDINNNNDKNIDTSINNNNNFCNYINSDNNNINNNNNNNNLNNSFNSNINHLDNYQQFLRLFEEKGFKVSIIEYESENYLGFGLKPNELFQIDQVLKSSKGINIFVDGSRFYINIANNHFIKASNETHGVLIQRTKTKFIIAIYQLVGVSNFESNINFSNILDSISEYNQEDFISCLI